MQSAPRRTVPKLCRDDGIYSEEEEKKSSRVEKKEIKRKREGKKEMKRACLLKRCFLGRNAVIFHDAPFLPLSDLLHQVLRLTSDSQIKMLSHRHE